MSAEVLTVLETSHQIDTSDEFQTETAAMQEEIKIGDWDFELTNFVGANADELVECPWQPGLEMTLSAVTLEWHIYMTPITFKNVDSILAQLQQLLANKQQVVETEPDDESKNSLEDDLDTSQTTLEPKSGSRPVIDTSKRATDTSLKSKPVKQVVSTGQLIVEQPITLLTPVEPIAANSTYADVAPYSSASTISTPPPLKNSNTGAVQKEIAAQLYTEPLVPSFESADSDDPLDTPQKTEQALATPKAQEITVPVILDNLTDSSIGSIEEITLDTLATPVLEASAAKTIGTNQLELTEQTQVSPDDFSQVEQLLVEIADAAEQIEIETAQKVHEIICKIIDLPSPIINETTIDEKLEQNEILVLFTELLEILAIDYTPELLESLARQTFRGRFELALESLSAIDDSDKSDQASSVSTVVRQLTVTLAQVRAAIDQAYAIGKSALQHFGLSLADTEI